MVAENESSDLQNIDFSTFGSILKRNGYTVLNPAPTTGTNLRGDGLYWFEYLPATTGSSWSRNLIHVSGGKILRDTAVSGTWTDITGGATVATGNHCDFETFMGNCYITNGATGLIQIAGSGTANYINTTVTTSKYVRLFNNYLFMANVSISGTVYSSRIYWSEIKNSTAWTATNFIAVAQDDGEEITGLKVLSDRLVIYKERSIYTVTFTGDADIPFILPGGGKSYSNVGCIAPWSIQEVENGNVFMSYDGLYYFDGSNSYKISDRVRATLLGYNTEQFTGAVSSISRVKNRYFLALPPEGAINSRVLVWDFYNNAFSIYIGMSCSDMAHCFVSGQEERVYFSDYSGFTYRMDIGLNDYPLNTATAISAYYWTNWRTFDDLVDSKGIPNVYIYYLNSWATLTFAYAYDFSPTEQYTQTFNTTASLTSSNWGTLVWGIGKWGQVGGGAYQRRDLTGRGRVVRFKFANSTLNETFRIDGFGSFVHLETHR